tara:strand:+ start:881 stop:2101 length:1221 start_codon:yes stop_codon:yes gene_type:complete
MKIKTSNLILNKKILENENILLIQDLDGVCIPLVKDPMKRKLDKDYILAAKLFKNEFCVLTCGEHEGERGVNRIIERSLKNSFNPKKEGLYLPGLAACGVEFQDNEGNISFQGISKKELDFLSKVPILIYPRFKTIVKKFFPNMEEKTIEYHASISICDTRFSPTINFNSLFEIIGSDWEKRFFIQKEFHSMMNEIINLADNENLSNSFFLHISPNLGKINEKEIIKYSTKNDIGTTDIQFLLQGAVKDSGVLILLNNFIEKKTGIKPFGQNFNFRDSPKSLEDKISFCKNFIQKKDMPLIIGIGDTITSQKNLKDKCYSRGGSDRSFLELIQRLGQEYNNQNFIIFVDSSSGEVFRPSTKKTGLNGITDKEDYLKLDLIFQNGPAEYINWFINIANKRYRIKNKK